MLKKMSWLRKWAFKRMLSAIRKQAEKKEDKSVILYEMYRHALNAVLAYIKPQERMISTILFHRMTQDHPWAYPNISVILSEISTVIDNSKYGVRANPSGLTALGNPSHEKPLREYFYAGGQYFAVVEFLENVEMTLEHYCVILKQMEGSVLTNDVVYQYNHAVVDARIRYLWDLLELVYVHLMDYNPK